MNFIFFSSVIYRLSLCFLLTLLGASPVMAGKFFEQHSYLQTIGRETKTLEWQLLDESPLQIRTVLGTEEDLTIVGPELQSRSWQLIDRQAGTAVQVMRSENLLEISGRLHGNVITEQRKIDSAPWYQTLSLSLRHFLKTEQGKLDFWVIRPTDLSVHKLRAIRKKPEELVIDGKQMTASKVEIRLTGAGSFFWKSHYWFRQRDDLFVRYAGPTGLPGSSMCIVVLCRIEK